MAELTEFLEAGKQLDLSGKDLLAFVEKREAIARETESERQKNEREERMQERELKQKALELEQAKEQSILKLQLIEKQIELARINAEHEEHKAELSIADSTKKAKLPKLPAFCDGKDNMDAYLKRFERFAKIANWPQTEWATNLSALLSGKALEVYSRLSAEDAVVYERLRDALLKRYQLTEEGFRLKFRNSKQEVGETAGQFVLRLNSYLSRWMELGDVTETFENLRDLFLREQFLAVSNKNLVLFLKERKIKSLEEMVGLAEQYLEAHSITEVSGQSFQARKGDGKSENVKRYYNGGQTVDEKGQLKEYRERQCYGCGKKDHFIKSCPFKMSAKVSGNTKAAALEIQRDDVEETASQVKQNVHTSYDGEGEVNMNSKTVATCMVMSGTENIVTVAQSQENKSEMYSINTQTVATSMYQDKKPSCKYNTANMPVTEGYIGAIKVSVLRDSGCNSVIVKEELVQKEQLTGKSISCTLADGTKRKFPVANIEVDTPYFKGQVEALCMPRPVYDLVLGNIEGVKGVDQPDKGWVRKTDSVATETNIVSAVETRAQKKRGLPDNLVVPDPISEYNVQDLIALQRSDKSLEFIREKAASNEVKVSKDGSSVQYIQKNGLFYRRYKSLRKNEKVFTQLVVPMELRKEVLRIAHDGIMSGHLGVRKTTDRVLNEFYWPTVRKDVKMYCRTCDVCQKTVSKGKVSQLPLGKMPIIDTPFSRIAIDLVGPIFPATESGNRFILTVVDYATRYPEAKALKHIDTETVAESLVEIYSRVGIPREVLTDQGKQFTSDVMKEVGRLLSIKQLTTTPYHPCCNGLVERFNGTLKSMLRRLCDEKPRQWDRYIPSLLFAYREAIQESTGFSPFQLLYGRQVRGPLGILKELWTKQFDDEEVKTTYQYVVDLRERLEETCKLVQDTLKESSERYKFYADSKSRDRQFEKGEEVLLLLPTDNNKLIMQWKGPYLITEKINPYDYKVNIKGKIKTYHGNMLKKYYRREVETEREDNAHEGTAVSCISVIEDDVSEEEMEEEVLDRNSHWKGVELHFPNLPATESVKDVKVSPELDHSKQEEIQSLIAEYPDVFTDAPGTTNAVEHEIVLTSDKPVRLKPYPVPYSLKKDIKEEIDKMLKLDIIEPSNSPYASPVVLVKKQDGTYRFCCDFRKLNSVTVFDAEPIGNPEELFVKMANSKYFTKIDLAKGYWQIKMKPSCKHLTAFVTSEGLFAFKKMPFGLVNSGATFCRMMRILLKGLEDVDNFVDDIIVHTETWQEHVNALRSLLVRLRELHLTARPTKCVIAVKSVAFLGHVIGDGTIQPNPDKVDSILNCSRPTTKKQVRSFLGLIGYYRNFIANFSAISAPLSDLTRKGQPNKVRWNEEQEVAFTSLIKKLSHSPILCLPCFDKPFIVRTDASDSGIGAVLLQEHDSCKRPISYASKKLLDREKRYSVVEKECYAIVWAVKKFNCYLYGREFTLETDHKPLLYLNTAKVANARLMRWALALQSYKFTVEGIKGKDNVGADFLSRTAQ